MKKLALLTAAVLASCVFAYAAPQRPAPAQNQPGPNAAADVKNKRAEFRKQFQAQREQNMVVNKALYERYKAAKTDKERADIDAQIKEQAAKQFDDGLAIAKKGISGSEEDLNKAKERQAKIEKNRDAIIERRIKAIKEGTFGQEVSLGQKCDGDKCPLTGVTGPADKPADNAKPAPAPAKK